MKLYFHGGKCCGIKTIAGFSENPETDNPWAMEPEQEKIPARNDDAYGHNVSTTKPFFTGEAPKETPLARLDRLIAFCRERRPKGAIEVTLAEGEEFNQNTLWRPILEARGFKSYIPPFLNSNSGNLITIYHLIYEEEKVVKASDPTPSPFCLDDDDDYDDEEEEYI